LKPIVRIVGVILLVSAPLTPPAISGSLSSTKSPLSPPVAEFIDYHPALKPVVRVGLLPAVAMSTVAANTTSAEKVAILGAMFLFCSLAVVWLRKRAALRKFE